MYAIAMSDKFETIKMREIRFILINLVSQIQASQECVNVN